MVRQRYPLMGRQLSMLRLTIYQREKFGRKKLSTLSLTGSLTSQATILVEVTGQNDAPIIQAPTPTAVPPLMAASGPVQLDVLSSISDDSAELTVTELDASETLGKRFFRQCFLRPA